MDLTKINKNKKEISAKIKQRVKWIAVFLCLIIEIVSFFVKPFIVMPAICLISFIGFVAVFHKHENKEIRSMFYNGDMTFHPSSDLEVILRIGFYVVAWGMFGFSTALAFLPVLPGIIYFTAGERFVTFLDNWKGFLLRAVGALLFTICTLSYFLFSLSPKQLPPSVFTAVMEWIRAWGFGYLI